MAEAVAAERQSDGSLVITMAGENGEAKTVESKAAEAKLAEAAAQQKTNDAVLWCIVMFSVILASALIGKVSSNHAGRDASVASSG